MNEKQIERFIDRCDDAEVSVIDGIKTLVFSNYMGCGREFYGDLGYWNIPDQDMWKLIDKRIWDYVEDIEELDDWTDNDVAEFVGEMIVDSSYSRGDNPTEGAHDYDIAYISLGDEDGTFYEWTDPRLITPEGKRDISYPDRDSDECVWLELYPYDGCYYSGAYNMETNEFFEVELSGGDASPGGGPEEDGPYVPAKFVTKFRERYGSVAKCA